MISTGMPVFVDKFVTVARCTPLRFCVSLLCINAVVQGQPATSIKNVQRVYVGSLGSFEGAEELKRELIRYLNKSKQFAVVATADQANATIDGKGELWIRGYHSLSPRARTNPSYAEPVYGGYLSVKLHGKDNEILWSYFADPRRVSIHELKRDLVDEVVGRLTQDRDLETMETSAALPQSSADLPAALQGAGATFPFPIYQDWFKSFHARHPAWTFSYLPTGSNIGIERFAAGNLDFAGTDIPPNALKDRIPPASNSFPTVGGAVVLVYNLPRFTGDLRLTPELIAHIFTGTIRTWSDPALATTNQSVSLETAPIKTFHRSDGSGTTYALTDYLSKTNAEWKRNPGVAANVSWAIGTGVSGNEAMAQAVASTPYSIGYVEFIYAFDHHLNFASIRNPSGRYVKPDLLSIMAAANGAGSSDEYLSLAITASPETNAYPISTFSWLVVPSDLDKPKKVAVMAFLEWMLTSGQRQCSELGYAPLPRNLVDRELSNLRKLK
jgi:phosphate transport system substrate-binding protein